MKARYVSPLWKISSVPSKNNTIFRCLRQGLPVAAKCIHKLGATIYNMRIHIYIYDYIYIVILCILYTYLYIYILVKINVKKCSLYSQASKKLKTWVLKLELTYQEDPRSWIEASWITLHKIDDCIRSLKVGVGSFQPSAPRLLATAQILIFSCLISCWWGRPIGDGYHEYDKYDCENPTWLSGQMMTITTAY